MLIACRFDQDKVTYGWNRNTMERASEEAEWIMYRALSLGLNFKLTMGNILTLTPALTITRPELDRALAILDQCLTEVRTATL